MPDYDIITMGEGLLRLTPPQLSRFEQAHLFEVHIGGSEGNTAVGLSRLGLKVAWLSRLPDHALGHLLESTLHSYGVDTHHIIWTDQDRMGLYFLEEAKPPRSSQVIYDRKDSAMSRIQISDIPEALFHPDGARLLHLTGITLSISESAAAAAAHAVMLAKQAGWLVSFDTNYRQKLCTPHHALNIFEPIMRQADMLFIPLKDARQFYGEAAPQAQLETLARQYPQACITMTMSKAGALCLDRDGSLYEQSAFETVEVGRVGGGDAFSAGFLYGYLEMPVVDRIPQALRWGAAAAALKYSIPGDMPLFTYTEVRQLVENGAAGSALLR